MRYAIFSDIHGNLEAIEAVLADIAAAAPDHLICLGDLVGYGASPNECVQAIKASGAEVIIGNHDQAATGLLNAQYFNDYARAAILWTRGSLDQDSIDYLKSLPFVITHPGLRAVHGSPLEPEEWDYVLSPAQAARAFEGFEEPICFIGHSHYPGIYQEDGNSVTELEFPNNLPLTLPPGVRHLINVGSVGQPRDNDSRAAWVLYDDVERRLTLKRVKYPVDVAQAKIVAAELPPFLAARLEVGI